MLISSFSKFLLTSLKLSHQDLAISGRKTPPLLSGVWSKAGADTAGYVLTLSIFFRHETQLKQTIETCVAHKEDLQNVKIYGKPS